MVTNFGSNFASFTPNLNPGNLDVIYTGQRQTSGSYVDTFATQQDLTKKRIQLKTATYVMIANDDAVLMDATAGIATVTLISPVGIGGVVKLVKKTDVSGNAVTVATAAGLIDGSATKSLASQYKYIIVMSDNTNWQIIGSN